MSSVIDIKNKSKVVNKQGWESTYYQVTVIDKHGYSFPAYFTKGEIINAVKRYEEKSKEKVDVKN